MGDIKTLQDSGIVDSRGFTVLKSSLTKTSLSSIKKELSLVPVSTFGNFDSREIRVFQETTEDLTVPIYYARQSTAFKDYTENVVFPETESVVFPKENFTLRPGVQTECYNKCLLEKEKSVGGGILNLKTGGGKSVLGIKILSSFKLKSLIIVNKIQLMKQWTQELQDKLPGIKIGTIQGKTFNHEGCQVVIGMLQTLSMSKAITCDSLKSFGVCIIDEVHGIASEVFSKIMFKVRPKYLFGLTATLERKDKMEKLILWYIGNVLFSDTSQLKQQSDIRTISFKGDSSKELLLRDGTPAVSSMISNIGLDAERTRLLVGIIKDLAENKENQILVLSDRTAQLKNLHSKLPGISGLFIGSLKPDVLAINKESQVLLATYGMASEGFNVPRLNCLVFATPRSNVTQSIGRIYRKIHPKPPIIVDIVDNFSIFSRQQYARRKIYAKNISATVGKILLDEEEVCLISDSE